jgi:hypothetical protein
VAAGLREESGRGPALAGQDPLRRHATKPQASQYGQAQMRDRYRPLDLLPGAIGTVIGADGALAATVARIMLDTGLAALRPVRAGGAAPARRPPPRRRPGGERPGIAHRCA